MKLEQVVVLGPSTGQRELAHSLSWGVATGMNEDGQWFLFLKKNHLSSLALKADGSPGHVTWKPETS